MAMKNTKPSNDNHFVFKVRDVAHFYRMVALCDQHFGKGNWHARLSKEHRGRVVQAIKRNNQYQKNGTDIYFVIAEGIGTDKVRDVLAIATIS